MEATDALRYGPILRAGRWFASLSAPMQEALLEAGVLRRLVAGETLFRRGGPPCGLYAMIEGAVRIGGTTEAGKEGLLTVTEPPAWFGEIAVFDGDVRTHDATAERASLVLQIPEPALSALLAREPLLWRELGRLLGQKLRLLFMAVEDLALNPLLVRLARRLVWMAHGYGERQAHTLRVVAASQEQLAMMLGASRQSVNGLLKELEAKGIIRLSYGQVELLELEKLREIAGVEAS